MDWGRPANSTATKIDIYPGPVYAFLRKRTVTLLRMHERCNLFAVCAMARINALRLRARQDRCALRIYNRESAVQSSVNVDYSGRCLFSSPFWSGLL